jgi:hypothetical protein
VAGVRAGVRVDRKTTIILERKDGKLVGADVLFG